VFKTNIYLILIGLAISSQCKFQERNSPQRRHCDDGVPEGRRNRCEVGAVDVLLGVEHDGGEDDDGHGQREDEEAQLAGAGLERVAEDPQSLRVARELEDAEDAEHAQRDEGPAHVVVVGDPESDVVRHDGHHVDDAHHRPHELAAVGGGEETQQVLRRKDHHAGGVQAEEHNLVALSAGQGSRSARPVATRHRLHHVGHDGHGDEEARHVVEDQGTRGRVRVLKGPPHLLPHVGQLLQILIPVLRQLVVHQPLRVLPLPVPVVLVTTVPYNVRHYAEEGQLLVVAGEAFVLRIMQFACPVVVEYVPEDVRVPVEEVLFAVLVVEKLPLIRT